MKVLLLPYLSLLFVNVVFCAMGAVRLNVLSSFGVDAKLLHSRLYPTRKRSETESTTGADAKKLICHYINTSMSVASDNRHFIFLTEIYDDLRENFSEIFRRIYQPNPADIPSSSEGRDMVYTNPTKPINLLNPDTGVTVEEDAFICLKQKKVDNKKVFQEFFVSEEYNVNDNPDQPNDYLAGRFIFRYNKEGQLVAETLAEEPATAVFVGRKKFVKVEQEYKKRRSGNEPVPNESDDPLCSLTSKQKSRICNLVLNSANFDGELGFLEHPAQTKPCEKRKISLEAEQVDPNVSIVDQSYEEWMFGCEPQNLHWSGPLQHWVSTAYGRADEVFVYRLKEFNKPVVQLVNLFKNIRINYV